MKREMQWKMTPSGRAVSCTSCSWWTPVIEYLDAAKSEFDAHVCADHVPLKNTQKRSTLQLTL